MKKTIGVKTKKCAMLVAFLLVISTMLFMFTGCESNANDAGRYNLDVVDATSNFFVNDFAGLFSQEQIDTLVENAANFNEETSGIQVVITTVKSLKDAVVDSEQTNFTVEEVSYSMYKEYGIGKNDMGILILISTGTGNGDGDIRIETGRQMQFYITDGVAGDLLDDYAMDYLYEGQYAEGLISLQAGVINEIRQKVPSNWNEPAENQENDSVAGTLSGENTSDNNVNSSEPKDTGNGLLWGFFGTIGAAIAALAAFIRQKLKGKSEKEELEASKKREIDELKAEHQYEISSINSIHEQNVVGLKGDYLRLKKEKDEEISRLESKLEEVERQNSTLTNELGVMKDKYERAQRLHPEYNFDEEVQNMIEGEFKASAVEIDKQLSEVLNTVPTKDNVTVFGDAISLFDSTDNNVRKYMTSDRAELVALYKQAVALKEAFEKAEQEKRDRKTANIAFEQISKVMNDNSEGNHKTYEALHAALAIFLGLTAAEKAFFPDNVLIEKLKRTHNSAKTDYDDYNAAKKAEKEVRCIIGCMVSADEYDRDKLARAKRYFDNLTTSQEQYFDKDLLSKLKKFISDAEEDHRRKERRRKEERDAARRRSMQSSSYRSSSSSGYRGGGGRPSGGGASRKF